MKLPSCNQAAYEDLSRVERLGVLLLRDSEHLAHLVEDFRRVVVEHARLVLVVRLQPRHQVVRALDAVVVIADLEHRQLGQAVDRPLHSKQDVDHQVELLMAYVHKARLRRQVAPHHGLALRAPRKRLPYVVPQLGPLLLLV